MASFIPVYSWLFILPVPPPLYFFRTNVHTDSDANARTDSNTNGVPYSATDSSPNAHTDSNTNQHLSTFGHTTTDHLGTPVEACIAGQTTSSTRAEGLGAIIGICARGA